MVFPLLLDKKGAGVSDDAGAGAGADPTYISKVLGIQSANLVGYWPLNEESGTAVVDASGNLTDGIYTNVTVNDALGPDAVNNAPLFNGTTSRASVISAALTAAWPLGALTISYWSKVLNAGIWTDGSFRNTMNFTIDGTNSMLARKSSVVDRLDHDRRAQGNLDSVVASPISPTDWVHWAVVGDPDAGATGEYKVYRNGAQVSSTQTSVIAQVGSLATALIGAAGVNSSVWSGWLAHFAIWNTALELADIQELADPNP